MSSLTYQSDPVYIDADTFKQTAGLGATSYADADVDVALAAASRAVDDVTSRRFWPDADATQVRYFDIVRDDIVEIEDLITLTSVAVDANADGVYETTWTSPTDFTLEPVNAPADGRPYERLRFMHQWYGVATGWAGIGDWPWWRRQWPTIGRNAVKITGQFGWESVPSQVVTATSIIASRLLLRSREAPFGVVGGGLDAQAVRIASTDPDLTLLLANLARKEWVV